jgi:YggT family protein
LIEISLPNVLGRAIADLLTLYMMLILLRWLAPWLQMSLDHPRIRWVCRLTDPLIGLMRRFLPPMGPLDFGPIAALFVVWVIRILALGFLTRSAPGAM